MSKGATTVEDYLRAFKVTEVVVTEDIIIIIITSLFLKYSK